MNRGSRTAPGAAPEGPPPAAQQQGDEPDLDLDRLVWDPEYRAAMRPRLKTLG